MLSSVAAQSSCTAGRARDGPFSYPGRISTHLVARLVGLNDDHAALWGSRIRGSSFSSPQEHGLPGWRNMHAAGTEGRKATVRVVSAALRMRSPLSFRLVAATQTSMVFQVGSLFEASAACTETGTYSIRWYKRVCCRASCKESTAPHDPRLLELSVEPHVSHFDVWCGCECVFVRCHA